MLIFYGVRLSSVVLLSRTFVLLGLAGVLSDCKISTSLVTLLCNYYGAKKLSITSLGRKTFSITTLGMTSTQHNVLHKGFVMLIVCFYNVMLSAMMPVL